MNYFKLTIYTNREVTDVIKAKEGDANSRFLDITLVDDDGTPYNLTGKTVRFNARKPDGMTIFNNCTILDAPGGLVRVELTDQTLARSAAGKEWVVAADISIFGDGERLILTTRTMAISVQAMLRDDAAIESSDEFGAVVALFQDVYDMRVLIADISARMGVSVSGRTILKILEDLEQYTHEQSTAGIVDVVNQIKTLIGVANPTTANTATVMNYLKKLDTLPKYQFKRMGLTSLGTAWTTVLTVNGPGVIKSVSTTTAAGTSHYTILFRVTIDGVVSTIEYPSKNALFTVYQGTSAGYINIIRTSLGIQFKTLTVEARQESGETIYGAVDYLVEV